MSTEINDSQLEFNEKTMNEQVLKLFESYLKIQKTLEEQYQILIKQQEKFPKKFVSSEDFEGFVILASQCKHKAIMIAKNSTGIYGQLELDLDYLEAQLLLNLSTEFLKDKGFDKPTEDLRKKYLRSNKNIIKLLKVKNNLESLMESSEKLIRAFESDEINFRKFLDLKNKLKGL